MCERMVPRAVTRLEVPSVPPSERAREEERDHDERARENTSDRYVEVAAYDDVPAHPCDEERTKVGRKLLGRDDGILVGEHVLAIEAAPMAANDAGGLLLLEVERAHGRETIEYHRALELGRRDGEHQGREHQYYSGQHRAHTHTRVGERPGVGGWRARGGEEEIDEGAEGATASTLALLCSGALSSLVLRRCVFGR